MVSVAIDADISARHLLFDSWFAFPATIRKIKALEMDSICMGCGSSGAMKNRGISAH
jgi:hypothetical protein